LELEALCANLSFTAGKLPAIFAVPWQLVAYEQARRAANPVLASCVDVPSAEQHIDAIVDEIFGFSSNIGGVAPSPTRI
jgi:hypothetical protein